MRISADAREATRQRILAAARELFTREGFDHASTRDLARAAGIAAGTLFNYFATKEAIAMTLVAEALHEAHDDYRKKRREGAELEEDLFAFVAAQLRRLRPHRAYLGPVLERALSPLAQAAAAPEGEALRLEHLETVTDILGRHGQAEAASAVTLHLYWTLFAGVLAFWSQDTSRHQEDTLAVLDQAIKMFVRSLPDPAAGPVSPSPDEEASHEP